MSRSLWVNWPNRSRPRGVWPRTPPATCHPTRVEMKQAGDKIPVSVLVVIYTPDLRVLLLERADHPGYWQSVTGSRHPGESLRETAAREVAEETGLDTARYALADWNLSNDYEIF